MPYVPGHKHDIFVSYSHVDERVVPGATKGWVTALVDELSVHLATRFGRSEAFDLWMDPRLSGNEPLNSQLLAEAKASAVLLVVVSPGYLRSDWCRHERDAFLEAVKGSPGAESRVFVVERLPVERPPELAGPSGYVFWGNDEGGVARPLSAIPPTFDEITYRRRVAKLGTDMHRALTLLGSDDNDFPRPRSLRTSALDRIVQNRVEPLPAEIHDANTAAGLFIGVGRFEQRAHLSRLQYAPDDAIALAHVFVVELRLIAPGRARLALGGDPASDKAGSALAALRDAGVRVVAANRTEILYAMAELDDGGAGGTSGFGLIAVSTHGLEQKGRAYLMPEDGARRFIEATGIAFDDIHQALRNFPARRRLVIVDACRSSVDGFTRGDGVMTDGFRNALAATSEVAILASCSVGQQSWESTEFEHGVFTHFLLQGMRGEACAAPDDGLIRLDNVLTYAVQRTTDCVRRTIQAEQLPWFSGDEAVASLPIAASLEAQVRAALHEEAVRTLTDRKQQAVDLLLGARSQAETRRLIPATVQVEVERELELREGTDLDELLEAVETLRGAKPAPCRLFVAWWKARSHTVSAPTAAASPRARWENSLAMQFVPLGDILFSVWQTRVQDFRAFVSDTAHDATIGFFSLVDGKWLQRGDTWKSPGFAQDGTHPVVGINWEDTDVFCRWLSDRERKSGWLPADARYRLPTDAEWTSAVGSGLYPWGDDWPPPPDAGRYAVAGMDATPMEGTSPVGRYRVNGSGIFDLGGNVWEWCDGWYVRDMNPIELRQQFDFMNDDGGGDRYRFMRGASWYNSEPWQLRSAYRNTGKVPNVRFPNVGFRVVLQFASAKSGDAFRP
jgi:uncharacterized caspase-like protein